MKPRIRTKILTEWDCSLLHLNVHPEMLRSWSRLQKRLRGLWLSGFGQDTCLQLLKPGHRASFSLPTHALVFHLGTWLSVLHVSLAKVGDYFPLWMECHSHFQKKVDERERRFSILELKGQHWPPHPQQLGNVLRWLPMSVFGSDRQD